MIAEICHAPQVQFFARFHSHSHFSHSWGNGGNTNVTLSPSSLWLFLGIVLAGMAVFLCLYQSLVNQQAREDDRAASETARSIREPMDRE